MEFNNCDFKALLTRNHVYFKVLFNLIKQLI